MRTLVFALLFSAAFPTMAQIFCNDFGNLIVISNYDGGPLDIVVDEDIPNLKIGLCSYEPMVVTISGPFAANVSEVWYAGFNSSANNNHCAIIPTTTISASPITSITVETYPPVSLADPDGRTNMIHSYQCSPTPSSGNTPAQVVHYFSSKMGAVLRWHKTQYNCYGTLTISGGGNCCEGICTTTVATGQDLTICEGDSAQLSASGTGTINWNPSGSLDDPFVFEPYASPAESTLYTAVVVTADGCFGSDTQRVTVLPLPATPIITLLPGDSLAATPGLGTYQWYLDGVLLSDTGSVIPATISGIYTVLVSQNGCLSSLSDPAAFSPTPSGLSSLDPIEWRLYPNPANAVLHLAGPNMLGATWQILDASGRLIRSGALAASGQLSVADLPPGAYWLQVGEQQRTEPFLIVR